MPFDFLEVARLGAATLDDSDYVVVGEGNLYKKATVGTLKNSILGSDAEYTEDTVPYLSARQTKNAGIVGKVAMEQLVGGSLGWNQLIHGDFGSDYATYWNVYSGTGSVSDGVLTVTGAVGRNGVRIVIADRANFTINHVFCVSFDYKATVTTIAHVIDRNISLPPTSTFTRKAYVAELTETQGQSFDIFPATTGQSGDIALKNFMCSDLTQMFGSTIADYVYGLEQATAGAGVAWLSKYIDLGTYHAYDAGSIQSVQATAHVTTGFNQWDEVVELGGINSTTGEDGSGNVLRTKNYIPILPNTQYYIKVPSKHSANNVKARFYDGNKGYLGSNGASGVVGKNAVFTPPTNARYVRFQFDDNYGLTYTNDICINISKTTGSPKNGDYVPYNGHTYPLGSDTLRGYPMLVNNKLAFDGDEKTPDGTIRRKYGIVDLGSLNWARETSANSGWRFYSRGFNLHKKTGVGVVPNMICPKYKTITANQTWNNVTGISNNGTSPSLTVCDMTYSDAASFKTAMSGVYLVYELETYTTESSTSFQKIQTIDADGTESFTTSSLVPVGHVTQIPENVLGALSVLVG